MPILIHMMNTDVLAADGDGREVSPRRYQNTEFLDRTWIVAGPYSLIWADWYNSATIYYQCLPPLLSRMPGSPKGRRYGISRNFEAHSDDRRCSWWCLMLIVSIYPRKFIKIMPLNAKHVMAITMTKIGISWYGRYEVYDLRRFLYDIIDYDILMITEFQPEALNLPSVHPQRYFINICWPIKLTSPSAGRFRFGRPAIFSYSLASNFSAAQRPLPRCMPRRSVPCSFDEIVD